MKLITSAEAKELNQNFIKTRSKELDKIVEKETGKSKVKDAISTWFSLDELKEYIAFYTGSTFFNCFHSIKN